MGQVKLLTILSIFSLLSLTGCSDPLMIIPGKALSGYIKSVPERWHNVPQTFQLETRPSDPYSVNIWGVAMDESLYVATRDTRWMQHIKDDNQVRVRFDGGVYELTASIVRERKERGDVVNAYVEKYDVEEKDSWVEEGTIYRLVKR